MATLIPFTVHIQNNIFLQDPIRIYIEPDKILSQYMGLYRRAPLVESSYKTICVEVEGIGPMPLVCGSNIETIEAFTIGYEGQMFGNKYFTAELFVQYIDSWICNCDNTCDDTCFLLLNNCRALVNSIGLLV